MRIVTQSLLSLGIAFAVDLVALPTLAHVNEVQAGKLAYFDETGFLGGGSTWGIVLPDESGGYARVCEEAYSFPAVIPPSFSHRRSDGTILLGGFAGAFISGDLGCTYTPIEDLDGRIAAAFAVGPAGRLFVGTANIGFANGVLASDDEGMTWTQVLAPIPSSAFFQLAASGARLLLTGTLSDGPSVPAVWLSEDAGETWRDLSAAYAAFPLVRATVFDGDDALFGGFTPQAEGIVLRAPPPYDSPTALDVVDAAGAPSAFPSEVTHVAVVPGGGGLVALSKQLGLLFHQPPGGPFRQVSDVSTGPTDCVFQQPDGLGLVGCGADQLGSLGLFMESNDGLSWRTLVAFDEVRYRQCPEGSGGATACANQFESSCDDNIDNDGDQDIDCADPECAPCAPGEGEGEEGRPDAGTASDDTGGDATSAGSARGGCAAAGEASGCALLLGAVVRRVRRRRTVPARYD